MLKLCLDYGHGGIDPGAVYKGRREADDNLAIGMEVAKKLRACGLIVGETRTSDKTISLGDRCDFANRGNYDYFISFHRNAFKAETATGAESYIYINASKKAKNLALKVQEALTISGFRNRGVKTADFKVLRSTKMPAVLVEIGFIDNSLDNKLFDSNRKKIIDELSKGIMRQLLSKA